MMHFSTTEVRCLGKCEIWQKFRVIGEGKVLQFPAIYPEDIVLNGAVFFLQMGNEYSEAFPFFVGFQVMRNETWH